MRGGTEGPRRIAVIGAGPAGLATVKELKEKGFEVTGFDRRPGLGGTFSDAYAGLQLTSSSLITSFGSFVREKDLDRPDLLQCGEYVKYLEEFAGRFDLLRHYRFSTTVLDVRRAPGGGWRVRSAAAGADGAAAAEREEAFDHVVICCGTNVKPQFPEWADPARFDGEIRHSGQVRTEADFAGKRVLVVGMGESGSDIALFAARSGAACAISTRNGPGYVIPRYYRGLPADVDSNRTHHGLPRSIVNRPIVRFKVKIENLLLPRDADRAVLEKTAEINAVRGVSPFCRFGTKSTAFVEAMLYHGAEWRPGVAELRRDRVVFADGTEFACDLIVCCTGFTPEFAFLHQHEPELERRGADARSLYRRMLIPELGTDIAWIGYVRPAIGGVPACAEMQARYLALLLSGEKALPSLEEMRDDVRLHAELDLKQFGHDAERLPAMADLFRFMESTAHEIGCRPPLLRLFLRDPRTALKVAFGPLSAAQYRLAGPGAEPARAKAVLRRLPVMPWPVLAYELMLQAGSWALGLTREPWRKWQRQAQRAAARRLAELPQAVATNHHTTEAVVPAFRAEATAPAHPENGVRQMERSTQVLVVGGGPAGSTAATLLAREGFRVTLLEREVFPRYHIGESLLVALNHIFDLLGLREKLEAHGFQKKTGAFFEWGTERWKFDWSLMKTKHNSSFQVKRSEFDQMLLEHAKEQGVQVHEGVAVRTLEFDGDRPVKASWAEVGGEARGDIEFDYLVDASGRSGIMANRYLRSRRHNEAFQNIAVWGYYRGVQFPETGLTGPILVGSIPEGWTWTIPLHDGTTSVGLVVHQDYFNEQKQTATAEEIYHEGISRSKLASDAIANAELVSEIRVEGDYSYLSDVLAGPGFFLSGDSAAFLDPLLSSGVHLATYSGMLAAACISSLLRDEIDQDDAAAFYSTCYREHYLRWMLIVSTFYDQNKGKESYFWEAQRLSTTDFSASDAAFTSVVAGLEDLKEARHTDLLAELSARMRENLDSNLLDADVEPSPSLSGDLLREEDLHLRPTAMGYGVVLEPRLGVALMSGAVEGPAEELELEMAGD